MTSTRTPDQIRTARESRRTWHGYLAHDNAAHIRDRIEAMLAGRAYTFVAVNTARAESCPPDVRTSRRLEEAPKLARPGHIICMDGDVVWGIHSGHATEQEARDAATAGSTDVTYLAIEGDGTGRRDRIEIRHCNAYRQLLHWVIAPEHPEVPGA